MKQLQFLGAAGEVTGSSYLLTGADGSKVLIDFGMFQGPKEVADLNFKSLAFKPSEVAAVFLTHAHLDHCGRLPLLVFGGFFGKIYMTAPTRSLVEVILTDAAKIAQESILTPPLYGPEEVEKILGMIQVVEYDKQFQVGGFEVTFRDSGHILGSASLEIVDSTDMQKVVFSGDLGNSPEDIVRPTAFIDNADVVVMESTYGDKAHPQEDISKILQEEINAIEKNGGVLLIPAFSLERTQELLHRIHHLKKDGLISSHTPVFMDSPMAITATIIFRDFKEFYNEELHAHKDDPFSFDGLVVTEDVRDSKEIIRAMPPKVIIAGSGMISGGRIVHHALNYLSQETTRILFVGYQSEETPGRKILEGARSVLLGDKHVTIRAQIRKIESLSSHADQPKLLTWLKHITGVKKIFLIHGDLIQRHALHEKIKDELAIAEVFLPQNNQTYNI